MTATACAATTPATGLALVAGVGAGCHSERDADELTLVIGRRLIAAGLVDVQVGTHWAGASADPTGRQVALSVTVPSARGGSADDEDDVRRALVEALPAGERRRCAVVVGARRSGGDALALAAAQGAAERSTASGGRAVYFPGADRLVGTVSIGDVLAWTPVDRARCLGGSQVSASDRLVTRNFVRPRWEGGELVLAVQPNVGGTFVPFESPDPTPCCADH